MTDYRKTPDERPWSRDLSAGDILTDAQTRCIDKTRLGDFDLIVRPYRGRGTGNDYIVRPMSRQDHRDRITYACGNVGVA